MSSPRWTELEKYSACDIADALLKLGVRGAGFLPDITPIPNLSDPSRPPTKIVAPASTFLMVPKPTPSFPNPAPVAPGTPMSNLTNATPYADLTRPQTIVLISQPAGQACAVVGGIMAARMQRLGAKAVVVDGRVRDLGELRKLEVPVWSKGTSVIGAGAETKFHAREVEIRVGETVVRPGDLVMVDEEERGIVCVPVERVEEVLELMEKSVAADERVLEDVRGGGSVGEAFKKFRS